QQLIAELRRKIFAGQFLGAKSLTGEHDVELEKKLAALQEAQRSAQTDIASIVGPSIEKEATLSQVKEALRPGEAFIMFHLSDAHVYSWAVTKTEAHWYRKSYEELQLPAEAQNLRGRRRLIFGLAMGIANLNPTFGQMMKTLGASRKASVEASM